jgi:hypothetical protein
MGEVQIKILSTMDLALSSLPELITHFLAELFGLILDLK